MTTDREVKSLLVGIALALLYLCVVLTPWPAANAQSAWRPGEIVGPTEVVIVGWRTGSGVTVPVAVQNTVTAAVQGPVPVSGRVTTERSSGVADRVVIVGWENRADTARAGAFRAIEVGPDPALVPGLPTTTIPAR
jgi:hypothetical protein